MWCWELVRFNNTSQTRFDPKFAGEKIPLFEEAVDLAKQEKLFDKIKYIIKPKEATQKISSEKFQEYKDQLMQRVTHIENGLAQTGIKTTLLNTKQLIRLFYEFYNPGRQ